MSSFMSFLQSAGAQLAILVHKFTAKEDVLTRIAREIVVEKQRAERLSKILEAKKSLAALQSANAKMVKELKAMDKPKNRYW